MAGADEPYEGILHVRICGGRRGQPRLLPGSQRREAPRVCRELTGRLESSARRGSVLALDVMKPASSSGQRSVRICAMVAIVVLLLTGLLPVFFFHFPGPRFMPFSFEGMWAFTHVLWKPLRLLIGDLPYLRERVNPYFVAPLINAALAFILTYCFLRLRGRKRSHGI